MSPTNYHERTVVDYMLVHWTAVDCDSMSMRATPFKGSAPPLAGRVQLPDIVVVINGTLVRQSTANSLPFYRSSLTPAPDVPVSSRKTMARDSRQLWKDLTRTTDKGEAFRILAETLVDKAAGLLSRLEREDAELCVEILGHGRRDLHSHSPFRPFRRRQLHQGTAKHNLKPSGERAFFVTSGGSIGYHGRLPDFTVKQK